MKLKYFLKVAKILDEVSIGVCREMKPCLWIWLRPLLSLMLSLEITFGRLSALKELKSSLGSSFTVVSTFKLHILTLSPSWC